MKSLFRPIRLHQALLVSVFPIVIGLAVIHSSLLLAGKQQGDSPDYSIASNTTSIEKHGAQIRSIDFSLTHKQGNNENTERPLFSSLQREKLIRANIFDVELIFIHSEKLARFSQPEYVLALSIRWHPSIPIAHRKLVI